MPDLVQPLPGVAAPAPAPEPVDQQVPPAPETPAETGTEPPDELLAIPAFQALFAGSPPAVSFALKGQEDRPERKTVESNADFLKEAGFRLYKTLHGDRGVLYNALHIHPDDLAAADKAGKLSVVAPDFDAVNHAVGKSGLSNPLFHAGAVPTGPAASRSGAVAPQSATQQAIADRISGAPQSLPSNAPIVPPASAGAQKRIAGARLAALQPQAPTSGTAPGQGALLASIMRPVV